MRATWPPVPPDDATPEQQQLFFAVCVKLTRAAVLRAAAPGHHAPHGRLLQRIRGSTSAPTHQLAWHIDLYCPSVEV